MVKISSYITNLGEDVSKESLQEKVNKYPYAQLYRVYLAHAHNNETIQGHAALFGNAMINLYDTQFGPFSKPNENDQSQEKKETKEDELLQSNSEEDLPDWAEQEIEFEDIEAVKQHIPNQDLLTVEQFAIDQNKKVEDTSEEAEVNGKLESMEEDSDIDSSKVEHITQLDSLEEEVKKKKKKKKYKVSYLNDEELSDFVKWLLEQKPLEERRIEKLKKKLAKAHKKSEAEIVAQKSIQKSDQIVSESLAKLLASQGHIHEAIEMYQQLSLVFPEKSSFFAVQIENLINQ